MEKAIHEERTDRERDPQVIAERQRLYELYVTPYYNMIYKLCMKYTFNSSHVQENYNEVLVNFYRRITTYNPEMSILTWLHIVTKREVFDIERRRSRDDNKDYDNDIEDYIDTDDANEPKSIMMDITNYREMYSDDVLAVLDEMKPIHRDALLLQQAGYSLKEIADIEYAKKTLKNYNIDTVKSRLFLARQYLKKHLTRDGERRD